LSLTLQNVAIAGIYKCVVDGRTAFSKAPVLIMLKKLKFLHLNRWL